MRDELDELVEGGDWLTTLEDESSAGARPLGDELERDETDTSILGFGDELEPDSKTDPKMEPQTAVQSASAAWEAATIKKPGEAPLASAPPAATSAPLVGTVPPELSGRGVVSLVAQLEDGSVIVCRPQSGRHPRPNGVKRSAKMPPTYREKGICVMVCRLKNGVTVVCK